MNSLLARVEALEQERAEWKRSLRVWKAIAAMAVAGALCMGPLPPARTQTTSYSVTGPASVQAGAQLTVAWTAPAGAAYFDWVGLFPAANTSNTGELFYVYTGGTRTGSATLTAPTSEGAYQFRYFTNNSRSEVARSGNVTVGTGTLPSVNQRLAALEDKLMHFSREGNDITISGANLHIVNGMGATNGNPASPLADTGATNGLGNLIIGYNELRGTGDNRSGSHNLVVGNQQNFTSFGGLLGGRKNAVSGPYSSVTGGQQNTASGRFAAVSGGFESTASGETSSVGGGWGNTASGLLSSVSGGGGNYADGFGTWVGGGVSNTARGEYASVSGGNGCYAQGSRSSVSGGLNRSVIDMWDWAGGGLFQDR